MSFFKKLFGKKEKETPVVEQEQVHVDREETHDEVTHSEAIEEIEATEEKEEATEEKEEVTGESEEDLMEEDKEQVDLIEKVETILEPVVEMAEQIMEPIVETVEELTKEEPTIEEPIEEEVEVKTSEVAYQEEELEPEEEPEVPEVVQETVVEETTKKKGFFGKLISGLTKTRDNILGSVDDVLKSFKKIDEDLYEELEEALIMADFGVETTLHIMEELRRLVKERKIVDPALLKPTLQEIITDILTSQEAGNIIDETRPNVVLVIGVNGAGKTTSIGKISNQLKSSGKKVVVAAADTFRAAAIEQLQVWVNRAGVEIIKHAEGSDPASVVYDGIQAAKARKADVLICDTAGRLQNKTNLMKELEKISRIIDREYPEARKEVLIVLDATTGQNAISQVKLFKEVAHVDGIILTKLDGTAKGGAIVGICQSMNVPVKYIGVGEKIEDLQPFNPEDFARALFATDVN